MSETVTPARAGEVWTQWTEAYFLRYTPEEIAWHTALLATRKVDDDTRWSRYGS